MPDNFSFETPQQARDYLQVNPGVRRASMTYARQNMPGVQNLRDLTQQYVGHTPEAATSFLSGQGLLPAGSRMFAPTQAFENLGDVRDYFRSNPGLRQQARGYARENMPGVRGADLWSQAIGQTPVQIVDFLRQQRGRPATGLARLLQGNTQSAV